MFACWFAARGGFECGIRERGEWSQKRLQRQRFVCGKQDGFFTLALSRVIDPRERKPERFPTRLDRILDPPARRTVVVHVAVVMG